MNAPGKISALREFPVVVPLPIQWGDLDAYGHVNHLVYLKWFETARALYASRVGVQIVPGQEGVGAVLASVTCKFLRQLAYPGDVFSGVRVSRLTIGGITLESCIVDAQLGSAVAEGSCHAVLWDYATGEPTPIPDAVRAAVEKLEAKAFPA